ncbi:hypothetical protein ABW636_03090 [Aquimarina sp. 2201CG1-2-11]|uniref:hypothetical protein n=1 Tax=Aquimarina discodermiae TaxID=3231043 RepID=UPI0034618009
MKLLIRVIPIISVLFFYACSLEEPEDPQSNINSETLENIDVVTDNILKIATNNANQTLKNGQKSSSEFSDWSGKVTVKTFFAESGPSSHNNNAIAHVDPDYVLVGGGAFTNYRGVGALLTESRPSENLTDWIASSKDHLRVDSHTLTVYAIGLKLEGVSADQLRQYIKLSKRTSSGQSHPNTFATVTNGYTLIGGGAKVNWSGAGNLLVHSYPSGSSWYVKSKDHLRGNPASITAYAIGIKRDIPNFGRLNIATNSNRAYANNNQVGVSTSFIPNGWVVTCPGGRTSFNGVGRLLTMIKPTHNSVTVRSKDHIRPDSGNIWSYAVRVQKAN